ncbi:MAG: T9SS type A sorting domain-containing protein [Flavobacteriales bacterium]|nr:T9SS type A sorting domain-containing protein [Flavobacteriales bacterium]MCB9193805.1 T9SS type A sorting domain-containing protein [Flavobacteriales bacterium]
MRTHALLLFASTALALTAQTPDPTFGTNGWVVQDAGRSDILRAVALQADGKIVAAGWSYDASSTDLLVARFDQDGALDATFGNGGILIRPTGMAFSGAEAVAIQPDEKILVAGYSNNGMTNGFTVWRLDPDGSDDPTFGTNGQYFAQVNSGGSFINAMALQPDGKILVTGPSFFTVSWVAVQRLNPDGTPDVFFNGTGTYTYASGSGTDCTPTCIRRLDDGRIVIGGTTTLNGTHDALALRLLGNGTLDTGLDGDGVRVVPGPSGADEYIYDLNVRPDGRYILTGEALLAGTYDTYFVQLAEDGSDSPFFSTSAWASDHGASEYCRGAYLRPDGKILTANSTTSAVDSKGTFFQTSDFSTAEDGDGTFGTLGWYDIDPGDWTYLEDMVVQPDGKVIVVGNTASGGLPYDMFLARYDMGIALDVQENGPVSELRMMPNPADDRLIVESMAERITSIQVMDLTGRSVTAQAMLHGTRAAIDVSSLAPGAYEVRVADGPNVRTARFVKR